jgi:hypothetical protein
MRFVSSTLMKFEVLVKLFQKLAGIWTAFHAFNSAGGKVKTVWQTVFTWGDARRGLPHAA